jgi:hypothetical protein
MSGLDGFTPDQQANARTIVSVAQQNFPASQQRQAAIVAIATALQESGLRNLNYGDRDSLGLFQQRASWGTVKQRTTPAWAAQQFFTHLKGVTNWDSIPVTQAAQAVQVSAFPDAYAAHVQQATQIVDAIGTSGVPGSNPKPVVATASGPWGALGTILDTVNNPGFWLRFGLFTMGGVFLTVATVKILASSKAGNEVVKAVKSNVLP